ncbi:primosomal protein N' [Hyphomonas oceanitis]|uniref:Replication restart protein PriA n=1 Tax=Hyphomonas oceanitis SCH89 TaxID=1280953 RepID=A0A059G853_9PROT|nr:primosomal protein N' [Hyphomonas oceanitis]KDA03027.1 primosome assembly protein PriA [Hyphomonas oceanitis SCH89]
MAVARILFVLPLPEPFDYAVPEGMDVRVGSYVTAPLGQTERLGVVWELLGDEAVAGRTLKPVLSVYDVPPIRDAMREFISWGAKYTVSHPGHVLGMTLRARGGLSPSPTETVFHLTGQVPGKLTDARRRVLDAAEEVGAVNAATLAAAAGVSSGVVKGLEKAGALRAEEMAADLPFALPQPDLPGATLTGEQAEAAEVMKASMRTGGFAAFLLDGVTGSGKTEVYFEAIAEALRVDPEAQILVLLPEIALTQAILSRFEARFGAAPAPWHSGLSDKERRRTWREAAHGRARIVIGARSALFLPYANLKLVIVDEEHDGSYKQEDGVTYHARDMAVMRAKLEGAAVVLASATPALETMVNAEAGRYTRLMLAARPGASRLPDVELVDLRRAPPEKNHWLSPWLIQALKETLAAGEQSLLFLNRRGYAPLVICKACGERLKTPGTENWLTEHRYSGRLVCHVTGYSIPKPSVCPACGAKDSLMGVGPGVERVAEEVRVLMPEARIEIFSSDTAMGGDATRGIIERMETGDIDVLIGTQIVAKGHNFPNLTLVGVVDADSGMKGGDLRAGERTYQLLSQVAGRAGRAERPGRALVQTYAPDNPAMLALADGDRDGFLQIERDVRAELGLPPFGRLAAMIVSAPSAEMVEEACREISLAAPNGAGIELFGPAPAPITVLRGRHRRRFLVKSPRNVDLSAYMAAWMARLKPPRPVRISVDIDPYSFM